jgi:hypothetical protein
MSSAFDDIGIYREGRSGRDTRSTMRGARNVTDGPFSEAKEVIGSGWPRLKVLRGGLDEEDDGAPAAGGVHAFVPRVVDGADQSSDEPWAGSSPGAVGGTQP